MNTALHCPSTVQDDCVVVHPTGTLDLLTYPDLRDCLLQHAVEQPRALVVDLAGLVMQKQPLLSVFAAVWLRTCDWPAVPLLVVADAEKVPDALPLRRYVSVHATLAAALGAVAAPPARRRTGRTLPCDPASEGVARHLVRETCLAWGQPQAVVSDAVLIAAELVINAVLHARSEARLRLELRGGMLTVAVSDDDERPAVIRDAGAPGARSSGYGLLLVAQAATTWGCVTDAANGRKVVWAVISTRDRRG